MPVGTLITTGILQDSVPMSDSVRTAVRDELLDGVSADADANVVSAIEDTGLSATESACRSSHELLDWDEYREVRL